MVEGENPKFCVVGDNLLYVDVNQHLMQRNLKTGATTDLKQFRLCGSIWNYLNKVMLKIMVDDQCFYVLAEMKNGTLEETKRMPAGTERMDFCSETNMGVYRTEKGKNMIILRDDILLDKVDKIKKRPQVYHKVYGATRFADFSPLLSKEYFDYLMKMKEQKANEKI